MASSSFEDCPWQIHRAIAVLLPPHAVVRCAKLSRTTHAHYAVLLSSPHFVFENLRASSRATAPNSTIRRKNALQHVDLLGPSMLFTLPDVIKIAILRIRGFGHHMFATRWPQEKLKVDGVDVSIIRIIRDHSPLEEKKAALMQKYETEKCELLRLLKLGLDSYGDNAPIITAARLLILGSAFDNASTAAQTILDWNVKFDFSFDSNIALRLSAQVGNTHLLSTLLSAQEELVPCDRTLALSIPLAIRTGNLTLLLLLLRHLDKTSILLNPGALMLRVASYYDHPHIVASLLKSRYVDPASDNNFALLHSARWGYLEIVRALVENCDEYYDWEFAGWQAARIANRWGHRNIIDLLVESGKVDFDLANIGGDMDSSADDYDGLNI